MLRYFHYNKKALLLISLYFGITFVLGCHVQMVADQDPAAIKSIIETFKEIDQFYLRLQATPADERQYIKYSTEYASIEADLRLLVLQNAARPFNEASTKISKNILDTWKDFKGAHASKNAYQDELIAEDQDSFMRLFTDLLAAETIKPKAEN